MQISVEPVGFVSGTRVEATDDRWGGSIATITLVPDLGEDALTGIEEFSHVEVLFHFHRVSPDAVVTGARHPRNNPAWPSIGIFAQRGKNRPNRVGSTICRVVQVCGRQLRVAELDAIEGTPILDIKPVFTEFLPREAVTQPAWSSELMDAYWQQPA
jgi:tRNA-Thr(GGU) m(6)t(6)A37 methyltransferase TsaA